MKSLHYRLSLIAFVLLIANPLRLWSGTHEEEALRIEKARERNWSAQYRTSPPALMELYVYDGAKTDADIDFITTCPKLWKLTITLPEKDLGKLTRLTRLEELNLWKSSFQGDGLTRLSGMTNLHTLKINYCKLSAKGHESLGSLDHIKTLEINPRDLLDFRNLNSLSQMQSLWTIALDEDQLWCLTKPERQQLANDLARLKVEIGNHYGKPLDVGNADPPPVHPFYVKRYSPFQLAIGGFAWRLTPWLGLFFMVVMVVSMSIWRSRAPWAIRASSYLPRFAVFGYAITLGFTLIVLIVLIPRRPYQAQIGGGDFWEMISKGIGQTNGAPKLTALLVGKKHCFFLISDIAGHGYSTLCAVRNQEVIDHFPKFLEKVLQDENISDLQLESLSDRSVSASNRLEVIRQLREKGIPACKQPEAIRQYLATIEWEKYASCRRHVGFEFDRRLQLEKDVADWESRTAHYWVTATFETAYFCLLLSLFWVPLLRPSLFRFAYRFWAIIPLLLVAPYQLGYCHLFDHPHVGTAAQGIFYPAILVYSEPVFCWGYLLIRFYPSPCDGALEWLNQPIVLGEMYFSPFNNTLGAVITSFAFWLIGGWLMKKAFPVKRTEGLVSSEQEKHVTPQEGATDKPDLPEERAAE